MRISFVLAGPRFSGGLRVIALHAAALSKAGHNVTIVTPPLPMLRRIKELREGRIHVGKYSFGHSLFERIGVKILLLDRKRALTDDDVPDGDAVIATYWQTVPWVEALSASKGRKVFFGQGFEERGEASPELHDAWARPLYKIVVSEWLAEIARERFGSNNVSLVPNSVDRNQFDAPPREKHVPPAAGLLYYHNDANKGCDLCLEAVQIARERVPDLRLTAFGRTARRRLPLPENTDYIREPAPDAIRDIYADADVWLWGSRGEGFGLPILEAMACRTPVISTATGAAPEILRHGGGVVLQEQSPALMAEALVDIVSRSGEAWRAMSDAAYQTITRGLWVEGAKDGYTWDDASRLFEQALENAAS
jgi:glycosyltransferase involved in cell wall biosynthesis